MVAQCGPIALLEAGAPEPLFTARLKVAAVAEAKDVQPHIRVHVLKSMGALAASGQSQLVCVDELHPGFAQFASDLFQFPTCLPERGHLALEKRLPLEEPLVLREVHAARRHLLPQGVVL